MLDASQSIGLRRIVRARFEILYNQSVRIIETAAITARSFHPLISGVCQQVGQARKKFAHARSPL